MINNGNLSTNWDEVEEPVYVLRLFVAGASPVSVRAINNLQVILNEHLKDRFELDIIDVHQQPLLVQSDDVTAVPMLIKKFPLPLRRLVGDMSDTNKVLRGLGLS
ncbi:circadian clock KaiB family protein [Mucilaginibacter terrae]|uniref:circadian clock KaiB family protein n=1 Tax=Mucilaginibacter terrae TaxID=1955052 RepID=UPI00362EA062